MEGALAEIGLIGRTRIPIPIEGEVDGDPGTAEAFGETSGASEKLENRHARPFAPVEMVKALPAPARSARTCR